MRTIGVGTLAALVGFALLLASCDDGADDGGACTPSCADRECGDDGCGGSCGTCGADRTCSEAGQCEPAESCSPTCAEAGAECGTLCGASCGSCGDGERCDDGACVCAPSCVGEDCGAPDGCGGLCEPCPRSTTCEGCILEASVVDRQVVDGRVTGVTIAVDYHPPDGAQRPNIADVRLRVSGPATVEQVGTGEALQQADKDLHVDRTTGRAWRKLDDGVIQTLVLSTTSEEPIGEGRWLVYRFRLGEEGRRAKVPVTFALVERDETLAPPGADQVLWGRDYDTPLSVWPEASRAP